MRFLLLLVAATSLLRLPGATAEINVVLSCDNQSCVFPGLDPCVEYTVCGAISTRSVELQFFHNLTSCGGEEANEAVTVRASSSDKISYATLTSALLLLPSPSSS